MHMFEKMHKILGFTKDMLQTSLRWQPINQITLRNQIIKQIYLRFLLLLNIFQNFELNLGHLSEVLHRHDTSICKFELFPLDQ